MENRLIRLPSSLSLEARLSTPRGATAASTRKLAVCLHPWSWLGGQMNDPVLHAISSVLLEAGYTVLRYNSRGVGQSSGWPSLTGLQEANDLQELVQWALGEMPGVRSLVIMGYSHGSLIASLYPLRVLPEDSHINLSHVLLSYPLGPRSWLTAFRGKHYTTTLNGLLHDLRSNILVVYGDRDEFTSVENYDAWAEALRRETSAGEAGTLQIAKVGGANHFWNDQTARETLLRTIRDWVPS
ncbi:hypothetical protein PHLGIDRAFT_65555 [Phlebiopsis gigantea 11061_1 CR5-6]|uniref:AB hydrolase-1 domain-containing protein n=1 Tax=Phlebiopsis gigantea (strain 11061_1 CR5-6) TaxID=745531 RepID=A0A0C3S481_PHLG1|nr:hypothetical protein PHLGIDRAFT_65555 [Phlebiopsis gigantea 11061_1 CR5-6]